MTNQTDSFSRKKIFLLDTVAMGLKLKYREFCSVLIFVSPCKDDFSVSIYLRHLLIVFLSKNIQFRMRKGHDQSRVPVQDKEFLKITYHLLSI